VHPALKTLLQFAAQDIRQLTDLNGRVPHRPHRRGGMDHRPFINTEGGFRRLG